MNIGAYTDINDLIISKDINNLKNLAESYKKSLSVSKNGFDQFYGEINYGGFSEKSLNISGNTGAHDKAAKIADSWYDLYSDTLKFFPKLIDKAKKISKNELETYKSKIKSEIDRLNGVINRIEEIKKKNSFGFDNSDVPPKLTDAAIQTYDRGMNPYMELKTCQNNLDKCCGELTAIEKL